MSERGKIIILLGASGAGKTTIIDKLKENDKIYVPTYYTTREKRKGEIDGKTYNYVSNDKFAELMKNMETSYECHGYMYGLPNEIRKEYFDGKKVDLGLSRKKIPEIKEKFKRVQVIYLNVNICNIEKRLILRGRECEDEIKKRIEKAKELEKWAFDANDVDCIIDNNNDLEETITNLLDVI